MQPAEISLVLVPRARFDIIDVAQGIAVECGDLWRQYPKTICCSFHTTAGYLEQSLCARLQYRLEHIRPFIRAFQLLFPPQANYSHDRLQWRSELSEEQRQREPRNADSHLTFIASGLKNCVTYVNRPGVPIYFIDLDGIHEKGFRTRQTRVVAYTEEEIVHRASLVVPVSKHPIDSVNLKDPRHGFFDQLLEWLGRNGIEKGRIDIALDPNERHAGLTVNEYETLLMRHDLAEVLRDPLRFMAMQGKSMLLDPLAIPSKTINYATYDLVRVFNEFMDALGASESFVEKVLSTFLRVPASRFFRMKRKVSLLVSDGGEGGKGRIIQGPYQSPIMVQWRPAERQVRRLDVTITRFT